HFDDCWARPVARRESPSVIAVVSKLQWILDSILLMNEGGSPAVLEVVDSHFPVEVVADAAKIEPEMRHLVNEQRSGVEVFDVVNLSPFERRDPFLVALWVDGKRGRS